MQVPMLVSSGHCVDSSTLEKLSNSDTLYGRPPTDPFTGTYTQMILRAVCRCESVVVIFTVANPSRVQISPNMVI